MTTNSLDEPLPVSVSLTEPDHLLPVAGIRLATAMAGLYRQQRDDVLVIEAPASATAAAVFTRNRFAAAPVIVARNHLCKAQPRYLLVNAGNANAGTGQQGVEDAVQCCEQIALAAGCISEEVLPFSTGVIGQRLPVERITTVIPDCLQNLRADGWLQAARAIMTTDTVAKGISRQVDINGRTLTITGIAKGSGMIRPDMATMLAFMATDAGIDASLLQSCLQASTHHSFNRISVDGDTSTNDACVLLATAQGPLTITSADTTALKKFQDCLNEVCLHLARAIIRDGEGATKFVTVQVERGHDEEECLQVAYTIAHSPLIKTALFASDPNWGRILAAVGRSGLDELDINRIRIYLGDVCIVEDGGVAGSYTEEQGQNIMNATDILIRVVLNRGNEVATIWTTDLSYEYVKINAEYRT